MMKNDFLVVGIGASAGSLPAMIEFFKEIPAGSSAAFVVISHLMRERRSHLDEILSRHAHLPVVRVESDTTILAGHIYVLAEGDYLRCENGMLYIEPREQGHVNRAADVFLASLAKDVGRRSVEVILSGGGNDGLKGVTAIHEAGGKVFAQDLSSAQVSGMPLAVIACDHPDQVLEPASLAREVLNIKNLQ